MKIVTTDSDVTTVIEQIVRGERYTFTVFREGEVVITWECPTLKQALKRSGLFWETEFEGVIEDEPQ